MKTYPSIDHLDMVFKSGSGHQLAMTKVKRASYIDISIIGNNSSKGVAMTIKLSCISETNLIKVLCKMGFERSRRNSGHTILKRNTDMIVISNHKSDIRQGYLKRLLKNGNVSLEEYANTIR